MKRWVQFLLFTMFCVVNAFPQGKSDTSRIVATVDQYHITLQDFMDRYEDYLVYTGLQDNLQARYAILNNMVNEVLLRHYDDNSKVYGNPEYQKEINWAWKETLLAYLKDREVYAKITVTEDELREAYKRSNIKLAVRHLYAPTEEAANNLYNLLMVGVDFKQLAKQVFTDSVLQNNGGYLGYITWGDTDPDFESVAFSLRVGEISKPVKTATGYSIIRVDDRIENPFMTEDDFVHKKHRIERGVRISKKKPYEEAYLKRVFDGSKVRFNKKAIVAVFNDLKKSNFGNVEADRAPHQVFQNCVQYKGRLYSQKEIESKLLQVPTYNRAKLTDANRLREGVLGLIMQDVLLDIATAKGYDTSSNVKKTYAGLANNIYLNYKRNEVLKQVPVSDSEVVSYYKRNGAYFSTGREINVREIVVDNDSLAISLKNRIEKGEDFGTLAEKYSLRKWSARNRGEMGLSPISNFGEMKDTFWDAPFDKILGPIEFDKYYGVFQVLSRKDGQAIDIDIVRPQIVNAIKNEKGFPYMKKHLDELSKKTDTKINDELVKSFDINLAG